MLLELMETINELSRKVNNLICVGTITQVNNVDCRARVKIGNLETGFISMAAIRAGNAKIWNPPEVGEQVLVFSPAGELNNGVIMGSIYSVANPAPGSSNKHIQNQPAGVEFTAPLFKIIGDFEISGNALINGTLQVVAGVTMNNTLQVDNSIHANNDIVAGDISAQGHIHDGDSGGDTGGPK